MHKLIICTLLIPFLLSGSPVVSPPQAEPVVNAVLFYSPNCGHCHLVITETLPPLFEKYGDRLVMVGIDVSQPGGQQIFRAALQYFELESSGVPFLVVGDTYLVGSADIPERFPGLIDAYLAEGGVGWPMIPGLAEVLEESSTAEGDITPTVPVSSSPEPSLMSATAEPAEITPTPGLVISGDQSAGSGPKFSRDILGNSLAVLVLAAMLVSVAVGGIFFFRRRPDAGKTSAGLKPSMPWLFPVLGLIGLGVAGYLAYVETAQVAAVCGPVGDCNAVQQSQYARLFGIVPIGVIGVAGYLMLLLSWILGRSSNRRLAAVSSLAILGMTTFGVLFSTYLTFLEPFVIGATCAWCLTSAVVMTALFWLSLGPGRLGLSTLME